MEFNCKSCGTPLENVNGKTTVVCDFCGLEQTLPKAEDPLKAKLFSEANADRFDSKFDIAKEKYEKLIQQYPDDNEAYWCKLLCEYGIEYVDDAFTEKRLPTCHRTVRESIYDNPDYKRIISRATREERRIYESEAKEIDRIQKEIIEIADKEEPYDIFICYKETEDVSNRRTKDSQMANKIYTYLTNKGYKVFFSRITLRDMVGSKFEPIIYSALNTAKVMLLITYSVEHVNAPWVRNEWSRFLEFMQNDPEKRIMPCYAEMDPYDLPEELQGTQGVDLTEIDFIESITRQIDSKFGRVNTPNGINQAYVAERRDDKSDYVQNAIKRAKMAIEVKQWEKALEFADNALNTDAECAEAYLVCALCSYRITSIDDLHKQSNFMDNTEYIRARQFASTALKVQLDNVERAYYYEKAKTCSDDLLNNTNYRTVQEYLKKASGYKDADEQLRALPEKQSMQLKKQHYDRAKAYVNADLTPNDSYNTAKENLEKAIGYKDAEELLVRLPSIRAEQFETKAQKEKEKNYDLSMQFVNGDLTNADKYNMAKMYLSKAVGYKDATELLESLPDLRKKQEQAKKLRAKYDEQERKRKLKLKKKEERRERPKTVMAKVFKISLIALGIVILAIAGMFLLFQWKFDWNTVQWLVSIGGGIWILATSVILSVMLSMNNDDENSCGRELVILTFFLLILALANIICINTLGKNCLIICYGLSIASLFGAVINAVFIVFVGSENDIINPAWAFANCFAAIMAAVALYIAASTFNGKEAMQWMIVIFGGTALSFTGLIVMGYFRNHLDLPSMGVLIPSVLYSALFALDIICFINYYSYSVICVGLNIVGILGALSMIIFYGAAGGEEEIYWTLPGSIAIALACFIMLIVCWSSYAPMPTYSYGFDLGIDFDDLFGWLYNVKSSVFGILKL